MNQWGVVLKNRHNGWRWPLMVKFEIWLTSNRQQAEARCKAEGANLIYGTEVCSKDEIDRLLIENEISE